MITILEPATFTNLSDGMRWLALTPSDTLIVSPYALPRDKSVCVQPGASVLLGDVPLWSGDGLYEFMRLNPLR